MKSLNDNPYKNDFPNIFTVEVLEHIKNEGFKFGTNDSYCYGEGNFDKWCDKAFVKNIPNSNWTINCYIFENSIGLDIDYDCGGNSYNYLWKFDDYSFEECYDNMVDMVNDCR
jgi:hypothetical protein